MKKISAFVLSGLLLMGAHGIVMAEGDHARPEGEGGKMKVMQCPMDKYTVPADCPLCGMKMEEKEMITGEAQANIDKSQEEIRKRS